MSPMTLKPRTTPSVCGFGAPLAKGPERVGWKVEGEKKPRDGTQTHVRGSSAACPASGRRSTRREHPSYRFRSGMRLRKREEESCQDQYRRSWDEESRIGLQEMARLVWPLVLLVNHVTDVGRPP